MHTTQGRTRVCLGRTEKGVVLRKHQYIPIEGNPVSFPGLDCELNSGRDLSHLTSFPRRCLDEKNHFRVRRCFQSLKSVRPLCLSRELLLEGGLRRWQADSDLHGGSACNSLPTPAVGLGLSPLGDTKNKNLGTFLFLLSNWCASSHRVRTV